MIDRITKEEKYRLTPAVCMDIATIEQTLPSMSDMDLSVLYGAFQSAHDGFHLWLNMPAAKGKSGDLIWHLMEDMDRAKTLIAKAAADRLVTSDNDKVLSEIIIKYEIDFGFPLETKTHSAMNQ